MASWHDHVLPHGPLREAVPGFWEVDGTLARQPLPRTMAVARLPGNRLWLHSVVALDPPTLDQLESLGQVAFIVVPSGMHRLDAPVYQERYPEARLVCPTQCRNKVEQVVKVDGTAEDVLPDVGVICHTVDGGIGSELVYELPVEGGVALVFCDALFNLDHLPGIGGWVAWLIGSSGFFGTTAIGRWMLADRAKWKAWLLEQSTRTDIRVISVAHGAAITEDCGARLRDAAERL